MKNRILSLALLVLLFVTALEAGSKDKRYSNEYLKKAENNSIFTMKEGINPLVESTIYNMIAFKSYVPDWTFDRIVETLNTLSIEGNTASIRYRAQLASLFITYPQLFEDVTVPGSEKAEELFKTLSDRIENKLFASN